MSLKKVYVPINPVDFAIEFINALRQQKNVTPPSVRQAISIAKILMVRLLKYHTLIPQDYVNAAVLTTYYEDQDIAQKIAEDIVEKFLIGEKPDRDIEEALREVPPSAREALMEIWNQIKLLQEEPKTDVQEFISKFRKHVLMKEDPWYSISKVVSEKEILLQGISSSEELIKYTRMKFLKKLGSLSPEDVKICIKLGWMDILKKSPAPWESIIPEWIQSKDTEILRGIKDLSLLAKTINFLRRAELIDNKAFEEFAQFIIENIVTLKHLIEVMRHLGEIDKKVINEDLIWKTIDESLGRMPLKEVFKYTRIIDSILGTDVTSELFRRLIKQKKIKLDELVELPVFTQEWREEIVSQIEEMIDNIDKLSEDKAVKYRKYIQLHEKLKTLSARIPIAYARHFFLMQLSKLKKLILLHAPTPRDFLEHLYRFYKSEPMFAPTLEEALFLAKYHNVSEEQIYAIYGSKWHQLKYYYKTATGGFNDLLELLNEIKPSLEEIRELMKFAIRNNSRIHLAALLYYDFNMALNVASTFGLSAEQLLPCLSAGPGLNLIQFWFEHKNRLPSECLRKLNEMVKKVCLDLAAEYSFKLFGSVEHGGIVPSTETRMFLSDEDFEYIDVESTLENLILSGKNPIKMPVILQDLIVYKRKKRRIPFIFILDFSGSMAGEKLALCAISVAMLAMKLKPEEFACALFESNTYIVKNLNEKKDIEQIVSDILQLEARGGTMVSGALRWAKEQIERAQDAPLIVLVILSDFEFFDEELAVKVCKEIIQFRNIRTILIAPYILYNRDALFRFRQILKAECIILRKIREIPRVLSEVIRKFLR